MAAPLRRREAPIRVPASAPPPTYSAVRLFLPTPAFCPAEAVLLVLIAKRCRSLRPTQPQADFIVSCGRTATSVAREPWESPRAARSHHVIRDRAGKLWVVVAPCALMA